MRIFEFDDVADEIRAFDSRRAYSKPLADGTGDTHVYALRFEADGEIGAHVAGYDQLFLVLDGDAWAAGPDDVRHRLHSGQGALFERGERHSKGSANGASVLMVQVRQLQAKV